MRGVFITLEGIDGCGKSTQLSLLVDALSIKGFTPLVTREPGGTAIGTRVREVLLSESSVKLSATAELLLMAADRAQHVTEFIRPALEAGRIVISDRHADSTVAFQGYGRGLDLGVIHGLNQLATGGLLPDLTILFDLDPGIARKRLDSRIEDAEQGSAERMSRIDDEAEAFHTRVRNGYLELARSQPERIRIVDAGAPVDQTHREVLSLVMPLVSPLCARNPDNAGR